MNMMRIIVMIVLVISGAFRIAFSRDYNDAVPWLIAYPFAVCGFYIVLFDILGR